MRSLRRLGCLAFAAALAGCGGGGDSTATPPVDTGDDDVGGDAAGDVTSDVADDAGDDDVETGSDVGTDSDAGCSSFGCDCATDDDCDSGLCIDVGDGGFCSAPCDESCDEDGYLCEDVDGTTVCVPETTPVCEACDTDADCGPGLCVELTDGSFCAAPCNDGCDDGFECVTEGRAGENIDVCLPESASCSDCVDGDGDGAGVGAACAVVDCDDTDGDVFPGADEACNGRDDDCDGDIDEDFDFTSDGANCGECGFTCEADRAETACTEGVCEIVACDGDWADCDLDPVNGCETDLLAVDRCGSCAELEGTPGDMCGTCGTGVWVCDGTESTVCVGDLGEDALNACGGCGPLDGTPGEPCAAGCDGAVWTCGDDGALTCARDGDPVEFNACGGCAPLDNEPDTPCGPCGIDTWVCDEDGGTVCDGETFANACGGCGALDDAPDAPCGYCDRGTFVCDGADGTVCEGGEDDGSVCNRVYYSRFGFPSGETSSPAYTLTPASNSSWSSSTSSATRQLRAVRLGF